MVFGTTLRLIYYFSIGDYDMQEDSLARVMQIYSWEKYHHLPGGVNWPFGHHFLIWIIGNTMHISYEAAGRILSIVCSIALIPVAYFFFVKIFNKKTAYLSLILYILTPFFIRFSTIQMTEIPFLFFVISGIYSAYIYFEGDNKKHLILSLLCLNMASLLRFEAWIIIPLFSGVFYLTFRKFARTILWGSLSLLSAIGFSTYSFICTGDPIAGVTASDVEVKAELANVQTPFWEALLINAWIPIILIPLLIVALIYAVYYDYRNRYIALAVIGLMAYYIFKMASGTLMPFWRYLLFVIFLSLPFTFQFLSNFLKFNRLIWLFLVFYCVYSASKINRALMAYQPLPPGFFESASFYKENYGNDDEQKIILSINPYSALWVWIEYANLSQEAHKFQRLFDGAKAFSEQEDFTIANVSKKIIEEDYRYILIQKGYEMDSILYNKPVEEFMASKKVEKHHFGEMTIIKIHQDFQ